MKNRNFAKMAVAMALSTSLLSIGLKPVYAETSDLTLAKADENQSNAKTYDKAKEDFDKAEKAKKEAEESLATTDKEIKAKDEEIAKEKTNEEETAKQAESLKDKEQQVQKDLNEKQEEKKTLESDLAEAKEANADLKAQEEEKTGALEKAKEEEGQSQKSFDEANANLEAKEKDLDKVKKEADDAQASLDKNKEEIGKLEKDLPKDKKSLEDKKQDLSKLGGESEAYKKAKDELDQATKKLSENEEEVKKVKADNSTLTEDKKAKEDALDQLEKENKDYTDQVNKLASDKKAKENKLKAKEDEKDKLQKDLMAYEEELENLKKKTKEALSQEDIDKAKAQWARGAMGFYETMGSQDALDVFTKPVNASKYSGQNSAKYLEANGENLKENDSRDLDRMRQSIEYIRKLNEIRKKRGGIDNRPLSIVGISDFEMAVAQGNANYSQDKKNHATQYNPPFENLYWGFTEDADTALKSWYSEEYVFDYLRSLGYKSRTEMDSAKLTDEQRAGLAKYYAEKLGNDDQAKKSAQRMAQHPMVGHYTNIVDHLMWPDDYSKRDSTVAGYAYRHSSYTQSLAPHYTQGKPTVQSMVLNYRKNTDVSFRAAGGSSSKIYTVDEYLKRFDNYYNDLKKKMEGKPGISSEDSQKIKDLESKIAELKKQIQDTKASYDTEVGQINNEIKAIDDKIQELKDANKDYESKKDALNKELEESNKDLAANKEKLDTLLDEKKELESEKASKEAYLAGLDSKRSGLDKEISDLEEKISKDEKVLKEAKTELEENEKTLATKKADQVKLEEDVKALADKKDALALDLANKKTATAKAQKAVDDLKATSEDIKAKEEKIAKLDKEIQDLEADMLSVVDRQKETSEKQKELSNKIALLQSQKAALVEKKAKLDEDYKNKLATFKLAELELNKFAKKLVFDLDGGSLEGSSDKLTMEKLINSEITLQRPRREGYAFSYWLANGEKLMAESVYKVLGDMNFKAVWEKIVIPESNAQKEKNKPAKTQQKPSGKANPSKKSTSEKLAVANIIAGKDTKKNPKTGIGSEAPSLGLGLLALMGLVKNRKKKED